MPLDRRAPSEPPDTRRARLTSGLVVRLVMLVGLFAAALAVALSTDVFDRITPHGVHDWVHRAGVWAPLLYLAGFLLRPLTMVPLTLWLLVGGLAFGWLSGTLYALVGVNLGAAGVFLGARFLGRDVVERLLGRSRPRAEAPRRWGARLVFSLQLFPFMPHDLLNAAAGWSKIPYRRFLIGSSLGTLPFVVLYTYAGSVLMAPGSGRFFVGFAALAALSIVSLSLARRGRADAQSVEIAGETSSPTTAGDGLPVADAHESPALDGDQPPVSEPEASSTPEIGFPLADEAR
jgi:uncharacterized membrane protein YdjX (TVP38/TMEM64 family)